MADSNRDNDQVTVAALTKQSLANSVAIAVSDATTALRSVQAIMTTVQSVAMARWLESGENDESYLQIANTATQITRDAVRLWQEVQATAQAVVAGDEQADTSTSATEGKRTTSNPSPVKKPAGKKAARKAAKKAARKPAKPTAAKRASASKKPAKPKPAAKKAAKKAAAKPAAKPRKPRVKPDTTEVFVPPADVTFPSDET
jgi:hypothetical protein